MSKPIFKHLQLLTRYQWTRKIKLIKRMTKIDLRSRKKFNNLFQSPLLQMQRRLRQPQGSLDVWLEALPTFLGMIPLLIIHLLLCLWPVCWSLQQRRFPTRKLGSPIWPQQPGLCSGTPDNSWIQTLFTSIQQIKRKPLPRRNSQLVRPWTPLIITLLFSMALGTKIVFEEIG